MDKYQLINDFIDGELEPSHESDLFLELSSNEELRQKLKNSIALKSTLAKNRSAFAPSLSQTSQLFGKLGFPDVFPISEKQPTDKKWVLNFARPLPFLILGAIIMLLLYPYLFQQEPEIIVKSDNSKHIYDLINQIPPVPILKEHKDEEAKVRTFLNNARRNNESKSYTAIEELQNINMDKTEPENIEFGKIVSKSTYALDIENRQTHFTQMQPLITPKPITNKDSKLSIELLYSQPFYTTEPTITPSKNALFNNNIAKLYYSISDELALGIEVRQENFYQVFEGMDEFGIINTYRQQPNFSTFGVFARYKIIDFNNIAPYVELNVGGNNAGLVYRGNTGIIFSPYSNFNIILSLEYSNLRFMHQQNWFNSDKFGINYGIGIKF